MNKDDLLKRIEKLIHLCEKTEPEGNDLELSNQLFTDDLINAQNHYYRIKDDGYSNLDKIDMMKDCNWIWKKRQKVKEIGWDEYNHIDRKIEESLRGGRKIEAIKTYRKHKIDNGGDCGLKEAKEYIDKLQVKMGLD
jgi:hypothetical protein